MTDEFEKLTDVELADRVWLRLIELDDELPDGIIEKLKPAYSAAIALAQRLKGPYCSVEGCMQAHMQSYPWCPWHRPASYGSLPEGYPPYPGILP